VRDGTRVEPVIWPGAPDQPHARLLTEFMMAAMAADEQSCWSSIYDRLQKLDDLHLQLTLHSEPLYPDERSL